MNVEGPYSIIETDFESENTTLVLNENSVKELLKRDGLVDIFANINLSYEQFLDFKVKISKNNKYMNVGVIGTYLDICKWCKNEEAMVLVEISKGQGDEQIVGLVCSVEHFVDAVEIFGKSDTNSYKIVKNPMFIK